MTPAFLEDRLSNGAVGVFAVLQSQFFSPRGMTMSDETKNALQITGQFRSKNSMVYDFRGSGNRLTLRITQRELPSDAGDWRVEASMGRSAEAVITAWGADPTEALRSVAQSWREQRAALGLPDFEWETIQAALTTVRAL